MNIVINSRFPLPLFFSFSWVMDGLSSKEGIGLPASSFLIDLCQFHSYSLTFCPLIFMLLLLTLSLIPLLVLVGLPGKALKSLSCSSYLLLRYAEFYGADLRSVYMSVM